MVWHDPLPSPKFPLPRGHVYAQNDGTIYTHSGVDPDDRPAIRDIQRRVGARVNGRYRLGTARRVKRFQRRHYLKADGQVGPATWGALF